MATDPQLEKMRRKIESLTADLESCRDEIDRLRGQNCRIRRTVNGQVSETKRCDMCLRCYYEHGAEAMRDEVASLFSGSNGIPSLAKLPLYERFIRDLPIKKSS